MTALCTSHGSSPSKELQQLHRSIGNSLPPLEEVESRVARQLVDGDAASIARAVMEIEPVREALLFMETISNECGRICQKLPDSPSLFHLLT